MTFSQDPSIRRTWATYHRGCSSRQRAAHGPTQCISLQERDSGARLVHTLVKPEDVGLSFLGWPSGRWSTQGSGAHGCARVECGEEGVGI